MDLQSLPDVRHPYTEYTLADAVKLALSNAQLFEHKVPASLEEVRAYFHEMVARSGHNWLTGAAALDVLDAAIDGKDIAENGRYR